MGMRWLWVAMEMIHYMNIIFGYAANSPWRLVSQYDIDFCNEVELDATLHWDVVHNAVLGRTILSVNFASTINFTPIRKYVQGPQSDLFKKEICRNFNNGHCNMGHKCRHEHKCSICFRSSHNRNNCFR